MNRIFLTLVMTMSCQMLRAQTDQWNQLGMVRFPENPSVQTTGMGRVSHLVFHPIDTNVLFAVSASGGLWKSSNQGETWKPLTDALPTTACASALVNTKNPKTMYLGTGDANYYGSGMGVWKSWDGGNNWSIMNNGMGNVLVVQMAMHPTDTNVIVATTNGGIFKTTDGGKNWVKKSSVTDEYNDLAVKPGKGYSLYATSHKYFYYSHNFGESWTQVNVSPADTFYGVYIGVSKADTNLVYTVAWRSKSWGNKTHFGGVFISRNAGKNWRLKSNSPQILGYSSDGSSDNGQGSYNLTITVDPKDPSSVYVGAICLWKSRDSGQTWRLLSPWAYGVHADKHHFIFSPHNSGKLYITHDGGIDRSIDTGNTWKTISDGLTASEFYKMGQSSLNREKALGGLQDNGLNYYKNGIFYTIRGGDYGGEFLFDYQDSNYQYFQGGGNEYNLNNFKSRNINGQDKSIYELHRKDTNVAYMAYNNLYRTGNLHGTSVSWSQLSDSLLHYGKATTTALNQCRANPNILYWGRNNGVLYRVDWVNSSKPVFVQLSKPSGNVSKIETFTRDSNIVYMSIGGRIYKSSNRGSTWWDFTKNLPGNTIVNFQVDDRLGDSSIYVATRYGVFYKNRSLSNWVTVSKNLTGIAGITDLELFNDGTETSCIRVSTYGRGIWQSSLYLYQQRKPLCDFSISPTTNSCPQNYILNDLSTGGKYNRKWTIYPTTGFAFINGTDSFSRQAEIKINQPGEYIVTLAAENSYGSAQLSKTLSYSKPAKAATCTVNTQNFGNYNIGIYHFIMAGIDKPSQNSLGVNPNLEDFSCEQSAMVKPGATYTATITNGNLNNEYGAVYIDYNNDGDFDDANEQAATFAQGKGQRSTSVKIINLPPVTNQFIRMRVVSDFSPISSSCGKLSYGQAEDYSLFIDNKKPALTWNMPKPKVYGKFNAELALSEYCPGFDTSFLKFTNARVVSMVKTDPMHYRFQIEPLRTGKICVSCAAAAFSDRVGNPNFLFADSTAFEMALLSFTFPGHSVKDSIWHSDTGGLIKCYVYHGTKTDSLKARFTLSDSSYLYQNSIQQISDISVNNYSGGLVFELRNPDGSFIKNYRVEIIEMPDTSCELLSFQFQSPNAIGNINGRQVAVTVPFGTSIKNRAAFTTISPGARIVADNKPEISGTTTHDFRQPIVYRVIAEDSNYYKDYTVTVTVAYNKACDLIAWRLINPADTGKFLSTDTNGGFISAKVPFQTSKQSLIAAFELSDSAIFKINGQQQYSGITANNYTDTVTGIVTSQDGKHSKTYRIFVRTLPGDSCNLLSFEFMNPAVQGIITRTDSGGNVTVSVPENTDITQLVPVFTVSDSASVFVKSQQQISGQTIHDFSQAVVYTVVSQSEVYSKKYQVTVVKLLGWNDPSLPWFLVYPNPARNTAFIRLSPSITTFSVTLFDPIGRKVRELKNEHILDISGLSAGMYELTVQYNGAVQTQKLVVE